MPPARGNNGAKGSRGGFKGGRKGGPKEGSNDGINKSSNKLRSRAGQMKNRALNAFDTAIDDEWYIKGMRQQQDIDLEEVADEKIRDLLNGEVKEEDDEEIDSDEAFGSGSDGDFNQHYSEEGSDWGDSIDENELVTLSEAWDMDDMDQSSGDETGFDGPMTTFTNVDEPAKTESKSVSFDVEGSDSESDVEDESDAEEEESDELESGSEDESEFGEFSDSEVSDSDEEADSSALRDAIKKVAGSAAKDQYKLNKYAGPENPFMLPTNGDKLTLEELGGTVKTNLRLVKNKITPKTLDVPLPQRIQQRADRGAAYELTKKEVSKWEDTVKDIRRAEHLSFPLNQKEAPEKVSPFVTAEKDQQNDLESKINSILTESSLLDERAASTFEDMATSQLSYEEVKQRRQELRYMRELMFREEQKAKRIKKIKSKSYRRVHKKEREHMDALVREAEGEEEIDPEEQERMRALERASLRHKASSKWAKQMARQGMNRDNATRAELEEMIQQGESLKRKVLGRGSDDEASDDDDGNDEDNLFELHDKDEAPRKGVLNMKFMRDAEEREKKANARLFNGDASDSDEDVNPGRKSFAPGLDESRQALQDEERIAREEAEIDNERSLENRLGKKQRREKPQKDEIELRYTETAPAKEAATEPVDEANPWMSLTTNKDKASFSTITKDSSAQAKTEDKLRKAKGKGRSKDVAIEMDSMLDDTLVRSDRLTLQQQDLVRKAFAGDDVVAEFEEEKQEEIEEDQDKEVDETLPGWGSWGGNGMEPRVRRIRKVQGVNEKKRKDYRLDNVIINEKVNKKNTKYNASAVPFPFENRAQYERSLLMPIGNEWSSKDTFQRQTKPRVIVRKGEVIEPVMKPKRK